MTGGKLACASVAECIWALTAVDAWCFDL